MSMFDIEMNMSENLFKKDRIKQTTNTYTNFKRK